MNEQATQPRIQDAMSALLASLGFAQMSKDVVTEERPEYLTKYARCIVKNSPQSAKQALVSRFSLLNII